MARKKMSYADLEAAYKRSESERWANYRIMVALATGEVPAHTERFTDGDGDRYTLKLFNVMGPMAGYVMITQWAKMGPGHTQSPNISATTLDDLIASYPPNYLYESTHTYHLFREAIGKLANVRRELFAKETGRKCDAL